MHKIYNPQKIKKIENVGYINKKYYGYYFRKYANHS